MGRINNDQVSGTIWLLIGLVITIASLGYGLGTLDIPENRLYAFLDRFSY